MNFQVTVLKILVSYPGGVASIADLKRDMAILVTSGHDWTERTKRLAARVPGLDIFSQGLVESEMGAWRITDKGREVLELMEARSSCPVQTSSAEVVEILDPAPGLPVTRTRRRREQRRMVRHRLRARAC